jgi:hypothetical protein
MLRGKSGAAVGLTDRRRSRIRATEDVTRHRGVRTEESPMDPRPFDHPSRCLRLALALGAVLAAAPAAVGAPGVFDFREHGAAGDGKTADTDAINRAVAACAGARGGQGRFPPGRYLSGTVRLRSKVAFYLEAGATLIGSPALDAYERFTPPAGTPESKFRPEWHRALLLGIDVEDVAIEGLGTIDGNRVFDREGEDAKIEAPFGGPDCSAAILVGGGRQRRIAACR